jgi:hypothetical protein
MTSKYALFLIGVSLAFAQPPSLDRKLADALSRTTSASEGTARHQAYEDVLQAVSDIVTSDLQLDSERLRDGLLAVFFRKYPAQGSRVRMAIIRELIAENAERVAGVKAFMQGSGPPDVDESASDEYSSLVQMVASFNDQRAIQALIGAMDTGSIASDAIVKYGAKALGPVLARVNDGDYGLRWIAIHIAVQILQNENNPSSREQTVKLLNRAIADSNSFVRMNAVDEIGKMPANDQRRFVAALQQIAQQDPFTVQDVNGVVHYTVRLHAKKILDQLAAR